MIKTDYVFDNKAVSYEVLEDGYKIYLDGGDFIHQYEPFIPNPKMTYEENALAQIEELVEAFEASQNQPSYEERIAMLEAELAELKAMQVNE